MPSRKQRRRREKLKRHEYEYVVETDEGDEVPVERLPARNGKAGGKAGGGDAVLRDRRGRPVPKPTWERAAKRGMIMFPLILLFIYLESRGAPLAANFATALVVTLAFVPFSYAFDTMMYRSMQKRATGATRGERR